MSATTFERDFTPIANALNERVSRYYERRGADVSAPDVRTTIDTNSTFVERRAEPLRKVLAAGGVADLGGVRLVDAGCGFGTLALFFAFHGASVTAFDRNAERLRIGRRIARAHDLDVDYVEARLDRTPFDDASFDVALANNSLCYVVDRTERAAVLYECRRLLRRDGVIVVRNPNRWHVRDQFSGLPLIQLLPPAAASRWAARTGRRRSEVRLVSPRAGRRELRRAGFADVAHVAPEGGRLPTRKLVARYQHLTGRKP